MTKEKKCEDVCEECGYKEFERYYFGGTKMTVHEKEIQQINIENRTNTNQWEQHGVCPDDENEVSTLICPYCGHEFTDMFYPTCPKCGKDF